MNKLDFEIDANTGCFNVTSHKPGKRGYPRTYRDKKTSPLHRNVYEFFNGEISKRKNIMVLHSCDNKMCINPKHLRLGYHRDNVKDAFKNRRILLNKELNLKYWWHCKFCWQPFFREKSRLYLFCSVRHALKYLNSQREHQVFAIRCRWDKK